MEKTSFAEIGKVEAISRLYENTPFKAFEKPSVEAPSREFIRESSRVLLEGTDFDLVYFPLKHLGYKAVLSVTGELYASMAHPSTLSVVLGVSAKLDYPQVAEIWDGIVSAAREQNYKKVCLDLIPSRNGLVISLSAVGETLLLTEKRKSQAKSKDLLCVSGSLGAAYLGQRLLERESRKFDKGIKEDSEKTLGPYKMLVAAYLKPELSPDTVERLEEAEIYPSAACFVTAGLSDAVKRIARDTGLGAKIYTDKIPFEGNSFKAGKELDIDPMSTAMNGGDDFRLLFTVPILHLEKFRHDFQDFDIIGHLAQPEAGTTLVTPDGVEFPLRAPGWPNPEED
jgi:thiamine-monophosphate kinase